LIHNFGPARPGEPIVHGACKPGYGNGQVESWLSFMKDKGIGRVVCLLSPSQLEDYETPLIESYHRFFGAENTLWNPVQDFNLIPSSDMSERIMPFLSESEALGIPVVVHCYAGMGRTGIVLAAWLSRARGLSPSDALLAVTAAGRKPMEVVEAGRATIKELLDLVGGR